MISENKSKLIPGSRLFYTPKMAVFQSEVSNVVSLDDTLPLTCKIEGAQNTKDYTVSKIQCNDMFELV